MKAFLDSPKVTWFITALIVYSVFCFSLETLPDLSAPVRRFLEISEIVVIAIFTAEYLARLAVADKPIKHFFSFYAMIDLLAILPFYLAFAVDLRSLRILRLLRLLRLLKLARYNGAIVRFSRAMMEAREELILFGGASMGMIYISAVGIYHFEHQAQPEAYGSIFDCLWWAVITLTTVGYGDIYPVTIGGRFFTFLILMIGLGLIAVPTGIITSSLSAVRREQEREDRAEENTENQQPTSNI
ncbi:ion transporter [Porticoccaceae bacterium]|nr:ion transporter [Porticoccaceae bacterium]